MRYFWLSLFSLLHFLIFHSHVLSSPLPSANNITLSVPQCHSDENSALLQLKSSFTTIISMYYYCARYANDTSPISKTATWLEGTNCCTNWSGISCDTVTGHVISLNLSCSNLRGRISSNSSLFHLRHLQRLDLSNIDLRGSPVLPEFGQFKNMTHLHLSYSNLTGHVPLEIAHLSKLVSLEIIPVNYDYPLKIEPATFKSLAQNLTNLRELDLSFTDMSLVPLVSFMNLSSSLTSLNLVQCVLSGEIPDRVFKSPQLEKLSLSRNNIGGQIPGSLNFGELTSLDLSNNNFVGQIPEICGNSSQNCSSKHLVSSFPLTVLKLDNNNLNGTVPSWIFALPYLEELDLSGNSFSGKIDEFRSISMKYIGLGSTNLNGNFPRSIYQQVDLTFLYLPFNNLTGTVELEELSKLNKLSTLDLSHNNLSVTSNNSIKYAFDNLFNLGLSSCNLSDFPEFFRSSKRLYSLDLSRNQMHGVVPKWLWEVAKDSLTSLDLSENYLTYIEPLPWNRLEVLDLRSNLFVGPLPIILASYARFYHVSKNNFSGEIPTSFCNLTSLEVLVLSYNNLSGKIPSCFEKVNSRLSVLDLQSNKFRGTISLDFVKGNSMRTLNVNGNELEGSLPMSLLNCEKLEVLDVGNNKISGPFPTWLESLPELQVLILRSNRFYGRISYPEEGLPFQKLRIMDVSNNDFTGPLPTKYFESFAAMMDAQTNGYLEYMEKGTSGAYYQDSVRMVIKGNDIEMVKIQKMFITIDFSKNNFTGEIPDVIGKLNSLKGLNFSHNRLTGVIPAQLGNLSNLECLDLSSNELTGRIPWQLAANLNELQILNLSRNKLEGPIPSGPQFNTFNNDSFTGNSGLCGFPLSQSCTTNTVPKDEDNNEEHGDGITLDWKVVAMGYASGVVIGISIGYMVLFSRRFDYWLMKKFGRRPLQRKRNDHARGRRTSN